MSVPYKNDVSPREEPPDFCDKFYKFCNFFLEEVLAKSSIHLLKFVAVKTLLIILEDGISENIRLCKHIFCSN